MTPLLDRVLEAHGGLDAWSSREALELRYRAGGLAFATKLRGLRMRPWHARVELRRPHAVLLGYPHSWRNGVLDGDGVRIETTTGELERGRRDPRARIRSPRRLFGWDDLDFLYFSAYAIWGYATFPFHLTLPGVEVEETGERSLRVRYPGGWPVHSRGQDFHFDASGLLVRNDYTAEPIGDWAHAANVCSRHRSFDGLVLPTRRRVHPQATPLVTLVKIRIDEVRAE